MKTLFRSLAALALAAIAAGPALAAKDVVLAVASTFTTTDPYDANDTLSQAMAKSFYEGLYGFDKDMKLIPVLAESYTVSPDGLVYTIKLRKGIKFHDGTDFKADAVKANFDRVTNPDNKLKRYGLYTQHREDRSRRRLHGAHHAEDALLGVHQQPRASPSGVIISPAALKQYGSKDIAFHPVGTGPFKFVEWKATDYLKVAKFDGYWKKGYPKVDTITWKPVIDNNTRAAVMQTGEAHFTYPGAVRNGGSAEGEARPGARRRAVDHRPLPVDEHAAEAVRQPEGAAGDQLRDQQGRAWRRSRSAATRRRPTPSCRKASNTR